MYSTSGIAGLLGMYYFNFNSNAQLISKWLNCLISNCSLSIASLLGLQTVNVYLSDYVMLNSCDLNLLFSMIVSVGEEFSIAILAIYIFLFFEVLFPVSYTPSFSLGYLSFLLIMLILYIYSEDKYFFGLYELDILLFFALLMIFICEQILNFNAVKVINFFVVPKLRKSHGWKTSRMQFMGACIGPQWKTSLSLLLFHFHAHWRKMATLLSVLAQEIRGRRGAWWASVLVSHKVGQIKHFLEAATS